MARTFSLACMLAVSTLCLTAGARAETGYVWKGDLNQDGIEDSIESGPPGMVGNRGGPFIVTLGVKKGKPNKWVLGLGLAVAVENTSEGVRLWHYWRGSLDEGVLCVDTLTDKPTKQECITLRFGGNNAQLSQAVYALVFAKGRMLEFKPVKDYKTPPNPAGYEWGKGP